MLLLPVVVSLLLLLVVHHPSQPEPHTQAMPGQSHQARTWLLALLLVLPAVEQAPLRLPLLLPPLCCRQQAPLRQAAAGAAAATAAATVAARPAQMQCMHQLAVHALDVVVA
jgi:hypothetical protein